MALLSATDLYVELGGKRILDDLTMSVGAGEVVAVQGVSGSGKSTLLHTLPGLLTPISGEVNLSGRRIDNLSDRRRSRIRLHDFGFVLQAGDLLPELSISENVGLPLRLIGGCQGKEIQARVLAAMEEVGIGELGDRSLAEVSGGQLQRAAIARAMIHHPKVILADEPTGSLDASTAGHVLQVLVGLARSRKSALVIVTHDAIVARECDERYALREGRLQRSKAHVGESV